MLRIIAFLFLVISQCNAVEISNGQFEATVLIKKPIDTSLKVGEVDDWFFSEAGISNDQAKVGEDVHSGNQFAFVNPNGHISQEIELETEKTYMITWLDASLDDSSYSVSVTQLNNGILSQFQTINTVLSISAGQHWSYRVEVVTPLRDGKYQLTFSSASAATFYIDKVSIKEVICEPHDSISDGNFGKTTPSAVWEYSNDARIIPAPDAVPRAEIGTGSYFAFCVPLFVGTYSFTFNLRRNGGSAQADLALFVSASERSSVLVEAADLDSQAGALFKTQSFTLEVPTEGIYSFAFMSQSYGTTTNYEINQLVLSARQGNDLNTGLPFYTGITTDPEFYNPQFEDYDVGGSDQSIDNIDNAGDEIWLFNGEAGISGNTSRLPSDQKGFAGQFAYVEPNGKIGQGIHMNANTDVVISFLTVVQPSNSTNTSTDLFSFNVKITIDAIDSNGFEADYPVYYSTDHKATQYVRRSFVFFTTVISGFYDFTIISATASTLLFDDFQIETIICDTAHPYSFDFTAQGGLPGPNWELFGSTVIPGIQIASGEAAGQCIVATEAADVDYEFSVKVKTLASSDSGDSTPLVIGFDSMFGGNAVISTYVGSTNNIYDTTTTNKINVVISLKRWNHYDTSTYPLLQAIMSAGFGEVPPPVPSKYFIYAYVDARGGVNSSPNDKAFEIDAIKAVDRVANALEINHQPYGGYIYVPQGIIGIEDVFLNDTRTFDSPATYTATSNQPTFFLSGKQPTFVQANNSIFFQFSDYADGPVTITVVNNNNNAVAHLDLFLCAAKKDYPNQATTLATCIRTQSHPRDVFVRRDVVYDSSRLSEFQPGDWWKNKVLDCSCNLIDMPSKQPQYIWPENSN